MTSIEISLSSFFYRNSLKTGFSVVHRGHIQSDQKTKIAENPEVQKSRSLSQSTYLHITYAALASIFSFTKVRIENWNYTKRCTHAQYTLRLNHLLFTPHVYPSRLFCWGESEKKQNQWHLETKFRALNNLCT